MREFQDLVDIFPYCLLVALPIMIFLAPPAVAVGHEFPAHRLAQLELGGERKETEVETEIGKEPPYDGARRACAVGT